MTAKSRNGTLKLNQKSLKEDMIKQNAMLVLNPKTKKANDEFTIDIDVKISIMLNLISANKSLT